MSKIDYQKLREIAEKTKIAGEAPVMPFDQRINALNDFMKHFSPDIALVLLDERERNQQYIKSRDQENEDIALTVGKLRIALDGIERSDAMLHGAEPASNHEELPLDYLQGQKDGLEWAAQLAEANHPQTGDWLYDDPLELAKAIRKGPDMPEFDGPTPVTPDAWISCSERMPNDAQWCVVDAEGGYYVQCWSEGQGWLGDDISLRDCDVIRWMPLPEPPQEMK
ncbi:TPA: DUF551 domain-containing protein [Escherichia coli]|nr:DUF551 domain-containing protein [Escherichia coli]HAX2595515.1 DUF551 domain-containing protein [Escherichia coli]HAX2620457.1 DUF551 domain-containing protein [Escherichia coli]